MANTYRTDSANTVYQWRALFVGNSNRTRAVRARLATLPATCSEYTAQGLAWQPTYGLGEARLQLPFQAVDWIVDRYAEVAHTRRACIESECTFWRALVGWVLTDPHDTDAIHVAEDVLDNAAQAFVAAISAYTAARRAAQDGSHELRAERPDGVELLLQRIGSEEFLVEHRTCGVVSRLERFDWYASALSRWLEWIRQIDPEFDSREDEADRAQC